MIPEFFTRRGWDGTRRGEAESEGYMFTNTPLLYQGSLFEVHPKPCLMTYPNVVACGILPPRNDIPIQVIGADRGRRDGTSSRPWSGRAP